jgi:hypothetical protein
MKDLGRPRARLLRPVAGRGAKGNHVCCSRLAADDPLFFFFFFFEAGDRMGVDAVPLAIAMNVRYPEAPATADR